MAELRDRGRRNRLFIIGKVGAPYFPAERPMRSASSIRMRCPEERAAAERELNEPSTRSWREIDFEIQEMRRAAAARPAPRPSASARWPKIEIDRISQAAQAEIGASERAAAQELRAATARLATERAAELVRARMNPAAEAGLFRSFRASKSRGARRERRWPTATRTRSPTWPSSKTRSSRSGRSWPISWRWCASHPI